MFWYNGYWVFHSFSPNPALMGYFWKSMADQSEHGPFDNHDAAYDAGRSKMEELRTTN